MPLDPTGGALLDTASTLGDTAGIAAGGGAAALAGASSPWTLPLTLLLGILPSIFGRRGQKDMTSLIQYLRPKQQLYMSPYLPEVDKAALNAVLNQMGQTSGWGWPGGK